MKYGREEKFIDYPFVFRHLPITDAPVEKEEWNHKNKHACIIFNK
jgi:hypothetical protein